MESQGPPGTHEAIRNIPAILGNKPQVWQNLYSDGTSVPNPEVEGVYPLSVEVLPYALPITHRINPLDFITWALERDRRDLLDYDAAHFHMLPKVRAGEIWSPGQCPIDVEPYREFPCDANMVAAISKISNKEQRARGVPSTSCLLYTSPSPRDS